MYKRQIKASPVMTTTAQSSRTVADTPTAASSQPILTPYVGTTTPKPVSTAAAPEVPAAAASTAPIVIVRQLKEVRPYDGKPHGNRSENISCVSQGLINGLPRKNRY